LVSYCWVDLPDGESFTGERRLGVGEALCPQDVRACWDVVATARCPLKKWPSRPAV